MNLDLVTASYASYRPGMRVPVATSMGKYPVFQHARVRGVEAVGRVPADGRAAVGGAARVYLHCLYKRQGRLWRELTDLVTCYPGAPLVLLCWESPLVAPTVAATAAGLPSGSRRSTA